MIEGMPWQAWSGVMGASVTLNAYFVWMLMTGRVATGRELREKNQRIEYLQEALHNRDGQVSLLMRETVPVTSTVMSALHQALEGGDDT